MDKNQLRQQLEELTNRFQETGGEVVLYAADPSPAKIRLGAHRKIHDLKEQAWQDELRRLRGDTAGTAAA